MRELQDEGDPDIVAEVGGLFMKHSPDKVKAIMEAAEDSDAKACSSQRTASSPAAPASGPCTYQPWPGAEDDGPLRCPG